MAAVAVAAALNNGVGRKPRECVAPAAVAVACAPAASSHSRSRRSQAGDRPTRARSSHRPSPIAEHGYNSWYDVHMSPSEDTMKATMDALVATGLAALGYTLSLIHI